MTYYTLLPHTPTWHILLGPKMAALMATSSRLSVFNKQDQKSREELLSKKKKNVLKKWILTDEADSVWFLNTSDFLFCVNIWTICPLTMRWGEKGRQQQTLYKRRGQVLVYFPRSHRCQSWSVRWNDRHNLFRRAWLLVYLFLLFFLMKICFPINPPHTVSLSLSWHWERYNFTYSFMPRCI